MVRQMFLLVMLGTFLALGGFYALLLVATFARSLPFLWRALGLLTSLGAVASLGFLRVGFQVGPGLGSALIVVLSGLLLGRVALISTFVLTLSVILGVGAYQVSSQGALLAPGVNDATAFHNWARAAVVYALFSGVIFIALMGIILSPIAHRVMHKFHIDEKDVN